MPSVTSKLYRNWRAYQPSFQMRPGVRTLHENKATAILVMKKDENKLNYSWIRKDLKFNAVFFKCVVLPKV